MSLLSLYRCLYYLKFISFSKNILFLPYAVWLWKHLKNMFLNNSCDKFLMWVKFSGNMLELYLATLPQPQHFRARKWHLGGFYFCSHFLSSGRNILKFDMKKIQQIRRNLLKLNILGGVLFLLPFFKQKLNLSKFQILNLDPNDKVSLHNGRCLIFHGNMVIFRFRLF